MAGAAVNRFQAALFRATPPLFRPFARFDVAGTEHVPHTGPVVLVGNHRSYFDIPAIVMLMRPTGRTGRILAKQELFDIPVVGGAARRFGGIPVDRGQGGATSMAEAAAALARGELVCLLPQGTIPRGERFYDPVLTGRTGAVRLARDAGAPVVPFGLWGTEQVWPRSSSRPLRSPASRRPTVRVRVGPPMTVGDRSPGEETRRVMAAVVDLLPPEARSGRTPTAEEIARATPRGR